MSVNSITTSGLFARQGRQGSAYEALRTQAPQDLRDCLSAMFDANEPYLDGSFAKKFAQEPDQRFWEMLLCARLRHEGKNVVPRVSRKGEAGPDILIEEDDERIWIEAVTFGGGAKGSSDRVSGPPLSTMSNIVFAEIPLDKIELRIASAIDSKIKKFRESYSEIVGNDRYIIAVAPAEQIIPFSSEGRATPYCVVYPFGDFQVGIDGQGKVIKQRFSDRDEIKKSSGSTVPTGQFTDRSYCDITGVIWCTSMIDNIAYKQPEFSYFPNCFASKPLSRGWANWEAEYGCTETEPGTALLENISLGA